jgi:hypothetical protein
MSPLENCKKGKSVTHSEMKLVSLFRKAFQYPMAAAMTKLGFRRGNGWRDSAMLNYYLGV